MKSKILVAIPCYNCSKQIQRVIKKFDEKLLKKIDKILILDNQSKDNTIEKAKKIINKIKSNKFEILRNNNNYNLGGSHKVAFNYALKNKFDYTAILHGDDQAETQELNLLLDVATKNPKLEAILGSRFMKGAKLKGYAKIRIWGNKILNLFFSIITFKITKDLGSGLNLFKMSELKDKKYLHFANSLTFNIDLLLDYYRKKSKIKFIPISWSETDQISNAKAIEIGLIALKALLKWRINKNKINKNLAKLDYIFTKIT